MKNGLYLSIYFAVLAMIIVIQVVKIKKLKNKIIEYERLKKQTYTLGDKIATLGTKDEVYDFILDTSINAIQKGTRGSILIRDEEDGLFRFKALRGFGNEIKNIPLKKEELHLYQYNGCKDIAILNSKRKNTFKNVLQYSNEIICVLAAPIHYDGKLIGVISIDSVDDMVQFNEEDIGIMRYIRHELELAIKNFFIQEKLKHIATHDELTGLFNRRCFNSLFEKELEVIRYRRNQSFLALLDLDDFKKINDDYGHFEGDKALIRMAKAMKITLPKTDTYARMSGDEFVIIFRNSTYKQAEEKLKKIREYLVENNDDVQVNFTYGLAEISNRGIGQRDEVFSVADRRMYEYKKIKKVGR